LSREWHGWTKKKKKKKQKQKKNTQQTKRGKQEVALQTKQDNPFELRNLRKVREKKILKKQDGAERSSGWSGD